MSPRDSSEAGSEISHLNSRTSCPVVGIGASAGGLEAVQKMLRPVSPDVNLCFVLVQHLDPNHESMMAELIARRSRVTARQIQDGDRIEPGRLFIIPPGARLTIKAGTLHLEPFSEPRGLRRPIDDFFHSLARDRGPNAACVILSGTGADGSLGLRAVKDSGGLCIAQAPETAAYDGMPTSAVGTGLVDFVLDPPDIVPRIQAFFKHVPKTDTGTGRTSRSAVLDYLDDICARLHDCIGHDFSGYKRSTLMRRIERRMQVLDVKGPRNYLDRIRENDEECRALFRDLLIHVTAFFRDPQYFEVLRKRVIEPLAANASSTVRVWVPGCSSGEEAYTIAMLLDSAASRLPQRPPIQVFATDIDEQMLAIARQARYPLSALNDIPEEFRTPHISSFDTKFEIAPRIRDVVRFSAHSIIHDPPFSRLDLISCRNLLIYMGGRLQRSLTPLMHYALKPGGFLFLGPSESTGSHGDLFSTVDHAARLYRRREGSSSRPVNLPMPRMSTKRSAAVSSEPATPQRMPCTTEVDAAAYRLIERYSPASAVVDDQGEILSSHGRLAKYLEYPQDRSNLNVVMLARPGLREDLRPLLRLAVDEGRRIARKDIAVRSEFGQQVIDLIIDPLPDGQLLVVFVDVGRFRQELEDDFIQKGEGNDEVDALEHELRETKHRLRTTVEELETANEELKSSNEEMMSMNEELQSANEELSTVNQELKNKVDELAIANADLKNFLASTELALVVLDNDLRIRTSSGCAQTLYRITESDHGRPLRAVPSILDNDQISADAGRILDGEATIEKLIRSIDDSRTYSFRALPYFGPDEELIGVTLIFAEVTNLIRTEQELNDQSQRLKLALFAGGLGVWEYDQATHRLELDAVQRRLLGLDEDEPLDIRSVLRRVLSADRRELIARMKDSIAESGEFRGRCRAKSRNGEVRWLSAVGRLIRVEGFGLRVIGVSFDVTAEQKARENQRLLMRELNHRVKNLFSVIGGMMRLSARVAATPGELAEDIEQRLHALARAHSVAQGAESHSAVSLSDLIWLVVEPHNRENLFDVHGPAVEIPARMITPMALVFYEFSTNSAKYGALASGHGQVRIEWLVNEIRNQRTVIIAWTEQGGSGVMQGKTPEGFGTHLLRASAAQMGGKLKMEMRPGGYHAELRIPIH